MPVREPLSVAVIARDEQRNLARCLGSVAWAEEIVVVDGGSKDATAEIARRHGARVVFRPWTGFVAQKNFALDQVGQAWVLSLDADEWLSSESSEEVREVLSDPRADAYAFNRLNAFCGAFLQRTWSPDWQVRLFRRGCGRFEGGHVHESFVPRPGTRVARLERRMPHLAYRSLGEYVERMNRYTDLAARSLVERGTGVSAWRMILDPPAAFLKSFVLRGGMRDGTRGFLASAGSSFQVLLK
jgi:glycosyltransferase involved in cell wall biosynthesis